jgi:outer membrane biosynthesis protein TonB
MVQVRFNADVNPNDGAWMATVSAVGPIPNVSRFNYRETTNGAITPITDTNSGTGFSGQIGQGSAFTPYVDPNTSTVQAAVDAANATIFQLNASLSPVVSNNSANQSALAAVPTTNSLTSATNSYITVKNQLNESLNLALTDLDTVVTTLPAQAKAINQPSITVVPDFDYSDVIEPDTETPSEPTEEQPQEESPEESPVENEETPSEDEQPVEEEEQPESEEQEQESPLEESSPESTTPEEAVADALEEALEDGELTNEEKEVIAKALIEAADGEALTAEEIAKAGLEYSDLPPSTPVEVRQDENGNQVIITADVAAALMLLENPAELIGAIFSDPGQALQALGSIGADMSPEEREEAEKMVIAAIIASGAALNAVGIATTGSAPTGGGSSGGGAPSGDSKAVRRRKP